MNTQNLNISLNRQSGVPLYIQIKEGIRKILSATPEGKESLLPPQRDLADVLSVSRNTVSMAYAELEREGLVAPRVGKGTVVVSPARILESRTRRERVRKAVEHAVEEALSLDFTLDEFADAVQAYLLEKKEMLSHIRVVFVECNAEQLNYFAEHLALGPGAAVVPMLLADIRTRRDAILRDIQAADMVVTSFYHLDELESLLDAGSPPILGVNLQPEMQTIVKIARIPEGARIGLVAGSRQILNEIGACLVDMGVDQKRWREFLDDGDPTRLRRFVRSVDAVIVTPSRRREVAAWAEGKQVVEFLFTPDKGSINNVRVALLELKRQRRVANDSPKLPVQS